MSRSRVALGLAFLLGTGVVRAEEAATAPLPGQEAPSVTNVAQDNVVLPKKKKAKKKKKKQAKRKPSSIYGDSQTMVVFGENHNFEQMVANKTRDDRALASQEQGARVIGVRRELGMTESDSAKAPQNIIINGGTQNGFEKGMILKVSRKIPVIDPYRENKQSELEVEFATAKIILASEDVAIARIQKIEGIGSGLYVGTRGILIGDFVK
jgi:hypothetical protein